jgi:hypothetical protein
MEIPPEKPKISWRILSLAGILRVKNRLWTIQTDDAVAWEKASGSFLSLWIAMIQKARLVL